MSGFNSASSAEPEKARESEPAASNTFNMGPLTFSADITEDVIWPGWIEEKERNPSRRALPASNSSNLNADRMRKRHGRLPGESSPLELARQAMDVTARVYNPRNARYLAVLHETGPRVPPVDLLG